MIRPVACLLTLVFTFSLILVPCSGADPCDAKCEYLKQREALVESEESLSFDSGVTLNSAEKLVDTFLSGLRATDIERFNDDDEFVTAVNFRQVKEKIESSKSFAILKTMPKGGLLHTHAFGDPWFLIKQGTYDPDCWINLGSGSSTVPSHKFMYSSYKPRDSDGVQWRNVVQWRREHQDEAAFDASVLYPLIQFYTPHVSVSQDEMWVNFDAVIMRVASLASKESIWRAWILDGLKTLADDGITHVEVRGFMNFICNPGTLEEKYNNTQIILIWKELLQIFNQNVHPSQQISMRFINSFSRAVSVESLIADLKATVDLQLNNATADVVVGFDIVDEEDRYHSLIYYLDAWIYIANYLKERNLPPMKYYFHTAETNWYKDVDSNLYDALLLNTTRIGHGVALTNYPLLQAEVIKRHISVEVCPISNQLLRVVADIREHPAREMLSKGVAITINSDDSVIYGYNGLTYDYWSAYTAWNLTLGGLKQLTQNGIIYSALPDDLKVQKLQQLDGLWKSWISDTVDYIIRGH
eukprot:TRINITY_DN109_c0_g5_i4.p1 TRINITY_DN109_c0_g5~~TRINITY_DN109_c0_g5_i4.p1  ORF type:complete len:527 (-),score=88.28 TRINITY_DN109_c0_g5_i4:87-1667(-)